MGFTEKDWKDSPLTTTPISAAALEDMETRLSDYTDTRSLVFDVTQYGATGDGSTNDTTAVQAAATAAIAAGGTLFFPRPAVYYVLTSTIILQPPSGSLFRLDIKGESSAAAGFDPINIHWSGGNSDTIFQGINWHYSEVEGIFIQVSEADTGIVGWDLDCPTGNTFWVQFRNCGVAFQHASNTGCVGWRVGHSNAGGGGNSDHLWDSCYVSGSSSNLAGSNIGWAWENQQCLLFNWVNCYADHLSKGWTASPTSGSNPGNEGGGGMTWIGAGATNNTLDFELENYGSYQITGGRFENGTTFLDADFGDTLAGTIAVSGVSIVNYARTGSIFLCHGSIGLHISGLFASNSSGTYHAQFIQMYGSGAFQTLTVEDSQLCVAASGFLYFPNGSPQVNFKNNGRMNTDGITTAAALGLPIPTVASAATVTLGPEELTIISGTTTITSVTASYVGRRVTLSFSGALTFTDGSNLKLAGNFVTTTDDAITLISDGTNWIETGRSVN